MELWTVLHHWVIKIMYEIKIRRIIFKFCFLGKKKYSISYTTPAGQKETITKVCGLKHETDYLSNIFDQSTFASMLRNYVRREKQTLKVPQLRRYSKDHGVFDKKIYVSFGNNLHIQRMIDYKSKNLVTYPYGYIKK